MNIDLYYTYCQIGDHTYNVKTFRWKNKTNTKPHQISGITKPIDTIICTSLHNKPYYVERKHYYVCMWYTHTYSVNSTKHEL